MFFGLRDTTHMTTTLDLTIHDSHANQIRLVTDTGWLASWLSATAQAALKLPTQKADGSPLVYALFHERSGRFLNPEVTLLGHRLSNGDRLRILPRSGAKFFEFVLKTEPSPGMLFPLQPREISIGRDYSNDIVIRHKSVSRSHGVFEWRDGFHIYTDIGSANGSWINDQPVTQSTPIGVGDVLSLGVAVWLEYREQQSNLSAEMGGEAPDLNPMVETHTRLSDLPQAQIYLSYSGGQAFLVPSITLGLKQARIRTWQAEPDPLTLFKRVDALVAILSREAVASKALQEEWREFAALGKPILPVLFEACRLPDVMEGSRAVVEYRYDDVALAADIMEQLHALLGTNL